MIEILFRVACFAAASIYLAANLILIVSALQVNVDLQVFALIVGFIVNCAASVSVMALCSGRMQRSWRWARVTILVKIGWVIVASAVAWLMGLGSLAQLPAQTASIVSFSAVLWWANRRYRQ